MEGARDFQTFNQHCQLCKNEEGSTNQSLPIQINDEHYECLRRKKTANINHIKNTFCSPLYNKQLKFHEKALKELNRVLCLCPGSSWIVFEILINMGKKKKRRKITYRTVIRKTVPARSKKFTWLLLCNTAHEYKTRNGQKQSNCSPLTAYN